MKGDLERIKDKYGENFMRLCRSFFPTLIDQGVLFDVISSIFQPSRELYDDIMRDVMSQEFKDYVLSRAAKILNPIEAVQTTESPFELMRKAGYTLYECKTPEEMLAFETFWANDESLCSFDAPTFRLNNYTVFFAVKDGAVPFDLEHGQEGGINGKVRSSFKKPRRQDEYGTSVIGIQFSKGKINSVSIKNRYNHSVENPDATFSNDLENIQAGLTDAFANEFGFNLVPSSGEFDLTDYLLAPNRKFYKFNHEINGTYFCPDNILITKNGAEQFDKSQFELVENFLIDKVNHTIVDLTGKKDAFCDALTDFSKLEIRNILGGREFSVTMKNGETATFTVDKRNRITSYENDSLTEVGDFFLARNEVLRDLSLRNLQKAGNFFLRDNRDLQEVNLASLKEVGDGCLYDNLEAEDVNLPNLERVGNGFMFRNERLEALNMPRVREIGNSFLFCNNTLRNVDLPSVEKIGKDFMLRCMELERVSMENVREIGCNFANRAIRVRELNMPNVEKIGYNFLRWNKGLKSVELPNVKTVGDDFLNSNVELEVLKMPQVKEIGKGFLACNRNEFLNLQIPTNVRIEANTTCPKVLEFLFVAKMQQKGKTNE